jgi:hypothetical protein
LVRDQGVAGSNPVTPIDVLGVMNHWNDSRPFLFE